MTISSNDVRRLLDSEDTGAVLVLIEGRTDVIAADQLDTDDYRGALEVVTRDDLVNRFGGTEPSDHDVAEQAATLDAEVNELGG